MPKNEPVDLLSDTSCGERVLVARCFCGRVSMRLQSMGIFPGFELRVVRNSGAGPVVVCAGNGRVCLERAVARRIAVETAKGGSDDAG